MSSKLFSCIQYRLDKLFPDFITVWLDKDLMVHAPFLIVNYLCLIISYRLSKNTLERSYFETKNLTLTSGVRVYLISYKNKGIIKIHYVWIILF